MKTREQIYGQEAAGILRDVSMYRALTEMQLLKLYPHKESKIRNLLSYTGEAPAKAEDTKSTEQPVQTDVANAKQDIIDRTNALRRENGVSALAVNDKLMQAAQVRADEMAAHTVYSHTRPNGGKFNTVTDCPYMAENIHRIADWVLSDQTLAERAVADWYASTVHHKNMVNPKLSEIGVGLARGVNGTGDPCWYCVQLFLYPVPDGRSHPAP
jgi:uncharacterized protein YkwD